MRRDPWGQYAFKAFISYNHRDSEWAEWIENELEAFRVPVDLIGAWAPHGPVPASVSPVFRDRTSLAAGSHLDDGLRETLDSCASLIVICSPNSAKSEYVHEEVLHFKRSGKADRIFPIIIGGEPFDKSNECFVESLKYEVDRDTGELTKKETAPIAADARKQGEGREEALVKIVAGVLGVEVGELREKHNSKLEKEKLLAERRARRAIIASLIAVGLTILAGITGVGAYFQRQEALARETELVARYVQGRAARGEEVISAALLVEVLPTAQGSIAPRPANPEALELAADLLAIRTLDRLIGEHEGSVLETAITQDGSLIATAGEDGILGIWEAETGDALSLFDLGGEARSISFSSDGNRLVAASASGAVHVWSVPDMELQARLDHEGPVNAVRFNPQGDWVISGSEDGQTIVWDIDDARAIRTIDYDRPVTSVSFTPDGQRVAVIVPGTGVDLWWARSGRRIGTLPGTQNVRTARFSPDSVWVLTATGQGSARIWNSYRATLLTQTPDDVGGNILSASFSPSGSQLVTTSDDNIVRTWDRRPGSQPQLRQSLIGHSALPWDAIYSPDGSMVLSASRDGSVRVWDYQTGAEHAALRALGLSNATPASAGRDVDYHGAGHLVMDQDGNRLVTLNEDSSVALWSLSALEDRSQVQHSLRDHLGDVATAAFSSDSAYIATGAQDNIVRLWNFETGELTSRFEGHSAPITAVSFDTENLRLASASEDGTICVWAISGEGEPVIMNEHNSEVRDVVFSQDGLWIASAGEDGRVFIRDGTSYEVVHTITNRNVPIRSIEFSPDSTVLLVADDSGHIQTWTTEDWSRRNYIRVHNDRIERAQFNNDGSLIVTASQDGYANISDPNTGEILQRLSHDMPVNWAEFIPGRSSVLTSGPDGRLRLWDARTGFEKPSPLRLQNEIVQAVIAPDSNAVLTVQNASTAILWTLTDFSTEASLREVRRTLQEIGVQRAPDLVLRELGLSLSTPPPFERYGLLSWKWWVPRQFWEKDDLFSVDVAFLDRPDDLDSPVDETPDDEVPVDAAPVDAVPVDVTPANEEPEDAADPVNEAEEPVEAEVPVETEETPSSEDPVDE